MQLHQQCSRKAAYLHWKLLIFEAWSACRSIYYLKTFKTPGFKTLKPSCSQVFMSAYKTICVFMHIFLLLIYGKVNRTLCVVAVICKTDSRLEDVRATSSPVLCFPQWPNKLLWEAHKQDTMAETYLLLPNPSNRHL